VICSAHADQTDINGPSRTSYPFSTQGSWSGQWPLASWQNLLITIVLLGLSYYVIRTKKISPAEVFSERADEKVVQALT
jgi:hypothetical protein